MATTRERRRILYTLEVADEPLSAAEIADQADLEVERAQSHLSLLRKRGYVRSRRPRKWAPAPNRPESPPR